MTYANGLIDKVNGNESNVIINQKLLKAILNPWESTDFHLIDLMNYNNGCSPKALNYEYMLKRNGAFRKLTFSEWNGGCRAITEPYWRGDRLTTDPGDQNRFMLGGSLFTYNTPDPNDVSCVKDGKVRHYYYAWLEKGIFPYTANGCSHEESLYQRKRWFTEDVERLVDSK